MLQCRSLFGFAVLCDLSSFAFERAGCFIFAGAVDWLWHFTVKLTYILRRKILKPR